MSASHSPLPTDPAADAGQHARAPRSSDRSARATVLLVEDEASVREFVRMVLVQAGYAVLTATNGDEGLTAFLADPDRIDLVLTDVVMPHRNGPALAAEIRRVRPDVRVLFMSAYPDGSAAHPIEIPPGTALLEKPFTLDRLLHAIAAAVGSRQ